MIKSEYKTKCNNNCLERIDSQAATIRRLQERLSGHITASIKASKMIVQLRAEKKDLTDVLNKVSERNKYLEKELEYWRNRESGEAWF